MKKQATEEQKKAAAERRERMRRISKAVSEMCPEERQAMIDRLGAVVTNEGRALSPHNTIMIMQQIPGASVVGGFRQWLAAGRSVKKGEKGAGIWIPKHRAATTEDETPDHDKDDTERSRFILGTVFDISQTEPTAETAAAA